MACSYQGCTKESWNYAGETPGEFCIFHAPTQKEQKYPGEFEKELNKQIKARDYNFKGYVFPIEFEFQNNFDGVVDFREAIFKARVLFKGNTFHEKDGSGIYKSLVADFTGARIEETLSFENVTFEGNVDFSDCEFNSRGALFRDVDFLGTAFFLYIRVSNADLLFVRTKFLSKIYTLFGGQVESGAIKFEEPTIRRGLDFEDLRFSDDSEFTFQYPKFQVDEITSPAEIHKIPRIRFIKMKFIPFATVFEGMKHDPIQNKDKELDILRAPVMMFRYCKLKDVFFRDCNISLLSFYACPFFEEAHFISCTDKWRNEKFFGFLPIKFKHRNIIFEDFLAKFLEKGVADTDKEKIIDFYDVDSLLNYKELPTLYRRLKTASDRAKDYRGAGRFYFNEFETKRQASARTLKQNKLSWVKKEQTGAAFGRYILYSIYRALAGYGEKPFRSILWFSVFTSVFAIYYLNYGLTVPIEKAKWEPIEYNQNISPEDSFTTKIIKYDLNISFEGAATLLTSEFRHDAGYCLAFSLYRVIPTGYLPGLKNDISIPNPSLNTFFLSFVNSFVLIMMIVFTGIGLKRHFRRF